MKGLLMAVSFQFLQNDVPQSLSGIDYIIRKEFNLPSDPDYYCIPFTHLRDIGFSALVKFGGTLIDTEEKRNHCLIAGMRNFPGMTCKDLEKFIAKYLWNEYQYTAWR